MKKMTFALACASAVAIFAEDAAPAKAPLADFESITADTLLSAAPAEANGPFWAFAEGDSSTVKAYETASDRTGANYLELSTEGNTLWRSINAVKTAGQPGPTETIPETGLYIDTMVQFTPTEDGGAPETTSDDKLAIWLNVTQDAQDTTKSVTNLMVKAGSYDAQGVLDSATYVLSGVTINAGSWYHLTVKAVDDICIPGNPFAAYFKYPAFTIMVDGVELASTTPAFNVSYANELKGSGVLSADMVDAITAGKVFPSCVAGTPGQTATLQAVGFKGSGALDNLQFTTEKPGGVDPAPVVNVDLTISADHATVTGITAGKVEVGSNLTFTVTAAEGYNLKSVTINGTTVTANADGNYTYPVAETDEAVAVVVTVVAAAPAYPTYIPDNAAIKSKFDAWVTNKANGDRDAASANMDAFLLNVAPGEVTTAKANFKIVSIEQNAQGAWVAKVTGDVGDGGVFGNGYVEIKGSATVDGTYNLATTDGTARFFKAFLVLEAPTTK